MFKDLAAKLSASASEDEKRLSLLGYKQELKRRLSYFHSFAVAFSYLSAITGLSGTYATLFGYGGPVTAVWTWVIVCSFNVIVGLAMAEICSAYPTSGGVYFWAYKLAGPKYRKLACWVTAWFNLLGNFASTAGVAYTTALIVRAFILLATGTAQGGGYEASQSVLLAIYAGILILMGAINSFAVRYLGLVGDISVWWHFIGGLIFVITLPAVAPKHQTAEWVFTEFIPDTGYLGFSSNGFLFIMGMLGSQWCLIGYDCAAHLAEETQGADYAGPLAIIVAIVSSFVVGIGYILSVTFSISDPNMLLSYDNAVAGGNPIVLVAWDAFKNRYGSGTGGLILMIIPLVCTMFCGNACVTANSRIVWAFSRDGGLPFSNLWSKVHPYFEAPINAVWLSVAVCFILFLPSLGNTVAFTAITSIGVIGLYISYAIPIFLRLVVAGDTFEPGPFHLGKWSPVIGTVAMAWLLFACVLFVLPFAYPVTAINLNYAPVMVGVVLVFSTAWYFLGARNWFVGPKPNVANTEDPLKVEKQAEFVA